MVTKSLKDLVHNRKEKNNIIRKELITSIVSKRTYIVPDEFAKEYIDDSVMFMLLGDFCSRVRKMSTRNIIEDDNIESFPTFYRKMDKLKPELKLFSSKYLKRINTVFVAILLISEDKHWKKWLVYNRKYITRSMHARYFLATFYLLNKKVPNYVLDYFVMNKKNLDIIDTFFRLESNQLCDKLIRDIERLNYPMRFSQYLFSYWCNCGTYFPENVDLIKPYLDKDSEQLKLFMDNASGNKPSLGFETFMALETIMAGLEPEEDDDVGYSFTVAVTSVIDHLFDLAKQDINILWAIPRTGVPSGVYQGILRDDGYKERFLDLMGSSETPLVDARLYNELFGYEKNLVKYQLVFIRRGGSIQTLRLDDDKINRMYNVCYTRDGLSEILTHSNESDIRHMIEDDVYFREFILSEMSRCSLNYLNDRQLRNLLKCIIDSNDAIYRTMYMVGNYIFKLLGEERMIKELPATMKLFLDNRMSRLLYPDSTKYIDSKTLPYLPIRLLSGFVVDRCLSTNILDGTKPPVLNTEKCRLDWVMTTSQMDKQFITGKNIGYIADLSLEAAEKYIQILSSK